ncbi:MAG: hypothetical protein J7L45_03225 [Candidatus Aenigmarchaeota archaeon]|nr:hypothetical protein [Candidatus Aenigmarchaeota archaeon]
MEFTKVFIIGLTLLIGFYVIFGGFGFVPTGSYSYTPSTRNIVHIVEPSSGEIFIGNVNVEDFKKFNLNEKPFVVSRTLEKKSLVSFRDFWVKNGLFRRKDYKRVFTLTDDQLKKLRNSTIHVHVNDTNLYGRLIIYLNNELLFSGILESGDDIDIPVEKNLLKKKNELVVMAESSTWRIWAPTVYILDLDFISEFFGETSQKFSFTVPKSIKSVKYSRLILDVSNVKGSGRLIVRLNSKTVFNGTPKSRQWVEFNDTVKCGENTIEMLPGGDVTFEIENAQLIIFWDRSANESMEMSFHVSGSQYSTLPGRIIFRIGKIFGSPSSLQGEIVGTDGQSHKLLIQGVIEEGKTLSIALPKSFVGVGDNKLILSVSGDGGLTISDIMIEY